ncbi:MAG: hypothetical protein F6J97_17370 [Leptolyngbya sp. SIO4C1]|nr:hypothetical protein [Leptolyngbya sp. SIO4C1]
MNYLVAVLSDRIKAEEAYSALESANVPLEKVAILGRGYQSADEYGLIDPNDQARKQMRLMSLWLVPFGFVAGVLFDSITGLNTFAWAGTLGNKLISGLLGAASGALGSFIVGGGAGLAFGSGDALPYRNRLEAGKYLLVVKGSEGLIGQSARVLKPLRPENMQGYSAQ